MTEYEVIERGKLIDDFTDMVHRRAQSYETARALARELNSPAPLRRQDIFNDYELEPDKWISWALHIGGESIATRIANACGVDREYAWESFLETISSNVDDAIRDAINEVIWRERSRQSRHDLDVC